VHLSQVIDGVAAPGLSLGHMAALGRGAPALEFVGTAWTFDRGRWAESHTVSNGFFNALGMRMLRGRGPEPGDVPGSPLVAVVNETFEREFGAGRSLLGASITSRSEETYTVIGVVGDTRTGTQPPRPAVYTALAQESGFHAVGVAIRTDDVSAAARVLRGLVRVIDPNIAIIAIDTMSERIARSQSQRRFYLAMLSLFAGLAGALAAIGIYSVTSHVAASRTRELGVRLALGAVPGGLVRLVLRQSTLPIAAGLAAGLATAWWIAKLLESNVTFMSQLFEVTPHDAPTYAVVAAGLLAVALIACWIPARRASRVDPARVLRAE
jgi:ABC-type antimicrobial peptide transport system permease subunit